MVLYALSATTFARHGVGTDFHRRQAAALAEGHLDIAPVPAALSELSNPYDAGANLEVRMNGGVQDLAYSDRRLYSAHGLTIPLLLLPSELLTGTAPPNWVITLVGACATIAGGTWALAQLRRRFVPTLPDWAAASTVIAFGLCGPLWAITSIGNGYEAAIAAAAALTVIGAALLLRSTEAHSERGTVGGLSRIHAAAGSALLAAAVGARPTAVVDVVIVLVAAGLALRGAAPGRLRRLPPDQHETDQHATDQHARGGGRRWGDLAAVVVPYAFIAVLIGASNAARFGSITEFGFGYQLSVWNMTEYPLARPGYLVANMVDQLLAAPQLHRSFPWLSLRPTIGGDRPTMHTSEPIVGLAFSAPVLLVGAFGAATRGREMWHRCRGLAVVALTAAVTGMLGLVATAVPFNTSSLRYLVDGAPMLILAACATWMWARSSARGGGAPEWTASRGPGIAPVSHTGSSHTDGSHTDDFAGAMLSLRLDLAWIIAVAVGVIITAATSLPT